MTTILLLYAKRLENINREYNEGKMTKKTLQRELRAVAKELNIIARKT